MAALGETEYGAVAATRFPASCSSTTPNLDAAGQAQTIPQLRADPWHPSILILRVKPNADNGGDRRDPRGKRLLDDRVKAINRFAEEAESNGRARHP